MLPGSCTPSSTSRRRSEPAGAPPAKSAAGGSATSAAACTPARNAWQAWTRPTAPLPLGHAASRVIPGLDQEPRTAAACAHHGRIVHRVRRGAGSGPAPGAPPADSTPQTFFSTASVTRTSRDAVTPAAPAPSAQHSAAGSGGAPPTQACREGCHGSLGPALAGTALLGQGGRQRPARGGPDQAAARRRGRAGGRARPPARPPSRRPRARASRRPVARCRRPPGRRGPRAGARSASLRAARPQQRTGGGRLCSRCPARQGAP